MKTSGYSGTPLAKKLGIKSNFKIRIIHAPEYYFDLFSDLPDDLNVLTENITKKNFIHYFTKDAGELNKEIASLKNEMQQDGMLWISWPKKASKIVTDVTEDVIRNIALSNGLVDIKVCAIDEIWSALKLVIPVKQRSKE